MKPKTLLAFLSVMVCAAFLALSCATRPGPVPEGLSVLELIQRGQEASDRNRFAVALNYYQTILERFPHDMDAVCAAEYEIAFIHYKQRNFDLAREKFNALLARYDSPDAALLPPQFKILSNIVLARMDETENNRRRRHRR